MQVEKVPSSFPDFPYEIADFVRSKHGEGIVKKKYTDEHDGNHPTKVGFLGMGCLDKQDVGEEVLGKVGRWCVPARAKGAGTFSPGGPPGCGSGR